MFHCKPEIKLRCFRGIIFHSSVGGDEQLKIRCKVSALPPRGLSFVIDVTDGRGSIGLNAPFQRRCGAGLVGRVGRPCSLFFHSLYLLCDAVPTLRAADENRWPESLELSPHCRSQFLRVHTPCSSPMAPAPCCTYRMSIPDAIADFASVTAQGCKARLMADLLAVHLNERNAARYAPIHPTRLLSRLHIRGPTDNAQRINCMRMLS